MKQKNKLSVIFGLGFVVLIALVGSLWYFLSRQTIPAGEVGLIYEANGGLQNKVYQPQAVYVGWREQLYTYPTKPQNALYTQDPSVGEQKSADGILITTSDNANTTFDISVIYHVEAQNVIKVFNTFGAIPIEVIQTQHIRRAIKDGVNEIGPRYTVFELMGPKRSQASDDLTKELQTRLTPKGITIDKAMILRPYPNQATAARINASINSFTQIGIADLDNQIATIKSQTSVKLATAQQKARALTASKTQAKSVEMLQIALEAAAIEKWNGHLSPIQPQPGQTIVLGGNELTGAMNKPQPKSEGEGN